jgi:hypothetical protein
VPGDRPLLDLGGSLADRDGVHDLPPAMPAGGVCPRPALHPTGPQMRCQLTLERTAGLHEQRQIDRLVGPHISGESGKLRTSQPAICCGDQSSPSLTPPPPVAAGWSPTCTASGAAPGPRIPIGSRGSVTAAAAVADQLPRHRRGGPAQPPSDRPHRLIFIVACADVYQPDGPVPFGGGRSRTPPVSDSSSNACATAPWKHWVALGEGYSGVRASA